MLTQIVRCGVSIAGRSDWRSQRTQGVLLKTQSKYRFHRSTRFVVESRLMDSACGTAQVMFSLLTSERRSSLFCLFFFFFFNVTN